MERLLCSLLSLLIAVCIMCILLGVSRLHHGLAEAFGFAEIGFVYGGFLCSLGWVLSLPFVIFVRNYEGWRYWLMLAIGTGIGPFTSILAFAYFGHLPVDFYLLWLPTGVSFVCTLLYLSFVRHHIDARRNHDC